MNWLALGVFVALMVSGLYLLVRNPPMPPPTPEWEAELLKLREATEQASAAIGAALIPAFERMIAALTPMAALFGRWLPRRPDPNPFPRLRLFRRTKR